MGLVNGLDLASLLSLVLTSVAEIINSGLLVIEYLPFLEQMFLSSAVGIDAVSAPARGTLIVASFLALAGLTIEGVNLATDIGDTKDSPTS